MKIIFLAPGLARIKRGTERFMLELSEELRKSGLDSVCWGTSEAPGIEAIAVPSRIELQKLAWDSLAADPNSPGTTPRAFLDWANYAEDQLFAIPAAARLQKLLDQGESVLVYARWQGGLIDPSGAPTDLLKVLAEGARQGRAALFVYTDYIHGPILSQLWMAGASFHSLGPWITESLARLAIAPSAIVELPMCVYAAAYLSARERREAVRAELGIPPEAFVVLSVGAFDIPTPDKRHGHTLREILSLPSSDRVWWIVAGSRGPVPTAWENEAYGVLGGRFIPLLNLPFDRMPRLYGAADLFTLASLNETFGLVYLEAQMAGLPVVIHDSHVTRYLCQGLPETLLGQSLVDMQRPGAASAAIARWRTFLSTTSAEAHTALDSFAQLQVGRFAWRSQAIRFAEAFRSLLSGASAVGLAERRGPVFWDDQFHREGIRLYEHGKYAEALTVIGKALGARETAERWSDWATIQTALGAASEAEQGFRRALALDPRHAQASANLGALLAGVGRRAEAISLLDQAIPGLDETQRAAAMALLESCRAAEDAAPASAKKPVAAFFKSRAGREASGGSASLATLAYCEALLEALSPGKSGKRLLGVGAWGELLVPAIGRFKGYEQVEWREIEEAKQGEQNPLPRLNPSEMPWPFEDASFDVVVFAQALVGIAADPMAAFGEINRILKPGGVLVLTAPNLASSQSLHAILRGDSPYLERRFHLTGHGGPLHRREYTAGEIETLASAAGFGALQLHTRDIFSQPSDVLLPAMAAFRFAVGSRGDTIFLRAEKECAVRERYPSRLYDLAELDSLAAAASENRPMRILVTFETVPFVDRGGADHRLMQIIRLLREHGHAVTFLAPRRYGEDLYGQALRQLGVELRLDDAQVLRAEGHDVLPSWTLQEVLRDGQFDLAILSLWFWMGVTLPEHYLDEIRRFSPRTRIAILTDDCHGLREEGAAALSGLWSDRERALDFAEREMEIHRRADLVIAISPADKRKIAREVRDVPVELLPMMVDMAEPGPPFEPRQGLVYLANFNNPASMDGLESYLRDIAPLVRQQLPGVKLYLVGAGLPEGWRPPDESVIPLGYTPDLAAEFARRRILVSPVRFGTGVKTKNLHALVHGLPIVTNTKGADGLDFVHGETALIADDPRAFASAVASLYGSAMLWTKLSENGRAHVQARFSKDAMDSALRSILARVPRLRPQPWDSDHAWSMRLVEKMYAEVLSFQPAKDRPSIRILAYSRAARECLEQGHRDEARRQLRHVFNLVPQRMTRSDFFGSFLSVAESMEQTYRALGESRGAAEFRREARLFSASAFLEAPAACESPALPPSPPAAQPRSAVSRGKSSPQLDFSVVVPTRNRPEILAHCLDALDRQSLSPRRFEVIVADDGSAEATAALVRARHPRYPLHYFRQENSGAGAARRLGVEHASGKYLLLINDDTIAAPDLLRRHLEAQRAHAQEKLAVLGDFRYPQEARNRALTHFLTTNPFLFPQVMLQPGVHANYSLFVTCNLSVPRDAVLAAGSFDPAFRVAEDTELGFRLAQAGFRVLYVPQASAVHQHLAFNLADLIRRAEIYAAVLVHLYEKHPSLLVPAREPFGALDEPALRRLELFVEQQAAEISRAAETLARFDAADFAPYFTSELDGQNAAQQVMDLFARSVPSVYWFHIFRNFVPAWRQRHPHSSAPASPPSLVPEIAPV